MESIPKPPPSCDYCHQPILPEYYYCPNCGASVKAAPITALAQIGWYAFAVFLPPLGLAPGIQYLKKKSQQAKRVGTIILILTLISSILMVWGIFAGMQVYLSQLQGLMSY